jgi:hypothetical protein
VIERWVRFWFTPVAAFNLGVSRALFFGCLFLIYVGEDFSQWSTVSSAYWIPIPLFTALHLEPLGAATLQSLQLIWRAALVFSALGILSRASMTVAFALGLYLLGLPHNFGQTYHFDALLVIAMGILACSRAGDAFSVDAWLSDPAAPAVSSEYTWPIRAIWVAMSLVFFAAGLAKLRYGGIEWVTSQNMSILLTRALYHVSDADPLTRAGLWIARHHALSSAVAAAAVTIEVAFPLALVSRKARVVLVPAAFGMLIGIRALMGPTFGGFLVANVFWVPWDTVAARAAAWARAARQSGSVASTRFGSIRQTLPASRFESHTDPRPTRTASPPLP